MTIHKVLLAACLLVAQLSFAAELTGLVVGVSDGDTITVLIDKTPYKIRLVGIDAPESRQAFGQASKQHLSALVYKKPVTVLWDKKDRYGRTLGKVMVDGTDVCLEQIKAGLAWHYKRYASEQPAQDRADYAAAEDRVKGERIGLWSDAQPTAPWDWRRKK
jgi:endonuclease YncB( thermonuclease family)